ncbi:MAG: glycosyltransferase, partial [bacterium]
LYLYLKHKNHPIFRKGAIAPLPLVTIQLPLYNEKYVIERLIKSICSLDYPKNILEIQILDDSVDETQKVAKKLVKKYKAQGFHIKYINRHNREGFKAGALDIGLKQAKGEFLAIFDADFVPKPDFLKKTLPYFCNKKVGLVQTRWGHINRDYSLLTRIQSMFLDGHFIIEHTARNRSGRFFNFNGTAGLWRKEAIITAGGWQHDTLTEDLDLSYRAQLAGWKFVYLPHVVAPAELPVEINAYKSQQHRWAKGSVQTAKKLLPFIFKSKLPFFIKLEASVHLVSNLTYLFMTIPSILMPIILQLQLNRGWDWMAYVYLFVFFTASLSVILYYLISQKESCGNWKKQIPYLPVLMSLGIGLSVNNAKAVLEALFNYTTEFKRTPKYSIKNSMDKWRNKTYRSDFNFQPVLELLLGSYFTISLLSLLNKGLFISIPFFLLFHGSNNLCIEARSVHPQ